LPAGPVVTNASEIAVVAYEAANPSDTIPEQKVASIEERSSLNVMFMRFVYGNQSFGAQRMQNTCSILST